MIRFFVVLPKTGRILSRELIYTALTRAKKRVVLLVQDSIGWLREFTKPQASVLARRNTNLFDYSVRAERLNIPYVEGLIHGTAKKGLFVRSKSEVVIVNQLVNAGVEFEYEQLLEENGHRCIPDFSFETPWGDRIIWEHLGMLVVPEYKASWERKLKFYEEIGYTLGENLFTTCDHENGSNNDRRGGRRHQKNQGAVMNQEEELYFKVLSKQGREAWTIVQESYVSWSIWKSPRIFIKTKHILCMSYFIMPITKALPISQ